MDVKHHCVLLLASWYIYSCSLLDLKKETDLVALLTCLTGMALLVLAGIFLENKFRGGKSSPSKIEGGRT